MRLAYYTDGEQSNFGDDINRWLWKRLVTRSLDEDDGEIFLGIGTLLSDSFLPDAKRYVVLGSGVGYGAITQDLDSDRWTFLAVRGPLTASVLGLPHEKGVIDSAVLVRLLPEFSPLSEEQRKGIAFMPHIDELSDGNWQRVCDLAGIEFLDPRVSSEETIARIRKASLVLASAMHAAIIADALRIPWIPVVISPCSNTFKWLDWTLSIKVPYSPTDVPPSTLLGYLRNFSLRASGQKESFSNHGVSNALRKFTSASLRRSSRLWAYWRNGVTLMAYRLPRKLLKLPGIRTLQTQCNDLLTQRASRSLLGIARQDPFLSDDHHLTERLTILECLLDDFNR